MRPTLRFTLAVSLTLAYEAFALQISHLWRSYQAMTSAASLRGYGQHMLGATRHSK